MKIGLSTGYTELYWGPWFDARQLGGSERLVIELANHLAIAGHEVTIRLPYEGYSGARDGVNLIPHSAGSQNYDVLFAFDDFGVRDTADRAALVACRSDPPPHTQFDEMIFLSAHHAKLMGHPGRPHIGGGVSLADYQKPLPRLPRRVICCSSPDRCPRAATIGRGFDFVHSYKPVPGFDTVVLTRNELVSLQQTAQVMIYPYDPTRESDFFSMAILESLAAGTPVVVADGPSLVELWGDTAIVLPRPIRLSEWHTVVEDLLHDTVHWAHCAIDGVKKAADYAWPKVAQRYLEAATN